LKETTNLEYTKCFYHIPNGLRYLIPSGHFYFNADIFSKGSVFASSKLQWSQELEHFSVCGESETAVVSRIQPLNNSLRFTFRLAVFLCGRSWLKVAKSEQSFLLITLIIFGKFFFSTKIMLWPRVRQFLHMENAD
jgi:hypothetical protein